MARSPIGTGQPRSGDRMQPTAQAVGVRGKGQSPGGAEEARVLHIRQRLAAFDLQEEFVAFLKRNKVAYDEKYIWG